MNWIFDAYSNVYQAAMMQSHESKQIAASAKERVHGKRTALFGLLTLR